MADRMPADRAERRLPYHLTRLTDRSFQFPTLTTRRFTVSTPWEMTFAAMSFGIMSRKFPVAGSAHVSVLGEPAP